MSGPFTHILVPVDGSEPSHRALKRARKLAEADGAELTVLEVVEPILYPSVPPYTTEDFVKELAEARYQQFKPLLESTTAKWNRLVREGFAADEICRVAEEEKCDLIAITSVDGRKHRALFEQVVGFGKPVFIDKPFASTVED